MNMTMLNYNVFSPSTLHPKLFFITLKPRAE